MRAFIYERRGELGLALENWNQAIHFDPNDFESCYRRGLILYSRAE